MEDLLIKIAPKRQKKRPGFPVYTGRQEVILGFRENFGPAFVVDAPPQIVRAMHIVPRLGVGDFCKTHWPLPGQLDQLVELGGEAACTVPRVVGPWSWCSAGSCDIFRQLDGVTLLGSVRWQHRITPSVLCSVIVNGRSIMDYIELRGTLSVRVRPGPQESVVKAHYGEQKSRKVVPWLFRWDVIRRSSPAHICDITNIQGTKMLWLVPRGHVTMTAQIRSRHRSRKADKVRGDFQNPSRHPDIDELWLPGSRVTVQGRLGRTLYQMTCNWHLCYYK